MWRSWISLQAMISQSNYSTRNPEEARAYFARSFLDAVWRGPVDQRTFELSNDRLDAGRFQLDRMRMTSKIASTFRPDDVYFVTYLSGGSLRMRQAYLEETAVSGDLVLSGQVGVEASTESDDLRQEVVTVSAAAVREAAGLEPGGALPTFASVRPLAPRRARIWRATEAYLRSVLASGEAGESPLLLGSVERLLAGLLLDTFPNTAMPSPAGVKRVGATGPDSLRRAVAFIEQNARRDIGIADIATAARISQRGVELAFRRHLETTPTRYLREVRLDAAHQELIGASSEDRISVTEVAHRWGFSSPGRFGEYYRRTFGATPGETLRR
jgi:AraC-like DNA-binding protein